MKITQKVTTACSFSVGPARVVPAFMRYAKQAYSEGIISINHRSPAFASLWKCTKKLLHEKLEIPLDYQIICCSSATECWEIIAQSFTQKGSYHLCQGAFAQRWKEAAARLQKKSGEEHFGLEERCTVPHLRSSDVDVLACTQNETSNGTRIETDTLRTLASTCRRAGILLATDATSSLGAVQLPWEALDLGFASVQKGLGLPAGLALLVVSPRAAARAAALGERAHYNSYLRIHEAFDICQGPYTPNILGIYLLMRSLSDKALLPQVARRTTLRACNWYSFLEKQGYDVLVKTPALRSETVIVLKGEKQRLQHLFTYLGEKGFPLSPGYGAWGEHTLRLGNFPAIRAQEITKMQQALKDFC